MLVAYIIGIVRSTELPAVVAVVAVVVVIVVVVKIEMVYYEIVL
jgi:hypothetical protein